MQQPTLSLPRDAMRPLDVVVVGSVMAAASPLAGSRVPSSGSAFWSCPAGRCRSDRFRRAYRSFAASFQVNDGKKRDSGSATGLYDVRIGADINVVVGCGLGGGS